jgi:hypothetical protein
MGAALGLSKRAGVRRTPALSMWKTDPAGHAAHAGRADAWEEGKINYGQSKGNFLQRK